MLVAAAVAYALAACGPRPDRGLAGEMGVPAFERGSARWSDGGEKDAEHLTRHTLAALKELRVAAPATLH